MSLYKYTSFRRASYIITIHSYTHTCHSHGFKSSLPMVFRPSRSVCASVASARGYILWILTFILSLTIVSNSSLVQCENSSRVATYWKTVLLISFVFFAASLDILKGGTCPDYFLLAHDPNRPKICKHSPNSHN